MIRYQLTIANLAAAQDIDAFAFTEPPINEGVVREPASGDLAAHERNAVLIGGTGTGETRLYIAIARAPIREGQGVLILAPFRLADRA